MHRKNIRLGFILLFALTGGGGAQPALRSPAPVEQKNFRLTLRDGTRTG